MLASYQHYIMPVLPFTMAINYEWTHFYESEQTRVSMIWINSFSRIVRSPCQSSFSWYENRCEYEASTNSGWVMWKHKERPWVCVCVCWGGAVQHSYRFLWHNIRFLGVCVFEYSRFLLKAARSLSCQDNHGGCIGCCREIQPFLSFLDDVALGQHDVWRTFATDICLKRRVK